MVQAGDGPGLAIETRPPVRIDGPPGLHGLQCSFANGVGIGAHAYQVVFLVGDAPPHMDYQDDVKYPETAAAARQRGIVINTVQCGESDATARSWQRIARLGGGDFFQVEQSGGALAVASPYDKELAELSAQLDKTRL